MKLAVSIKTFLREEPIFNLVESIKAYLPEARIYIADDSFEITPKKKELYKELTENGHVVVYPPADTGLSYGRNMLADLVEEDYVLYCDDDYVLTEGISAAYKAIEIMEADKKIGVITGKLYQGGGALHYEHDLKIKGRRIFKTPASRPMDERGLRQVDLGLNFFVARKEIFKSARWDNRLIISTEHMDFFLQLKYETDWEVYYFPKMTSLHCPPPPIAKYEKYRRRTFHWVDFADKWNIDEIEEGGSVTSYRTEAWKWADQQAIDSRILFRNDDISVDSNVDHLREIQEVFESYCRRELYMVTPFGKTLVLKEGYTHAMPIETLDGLLGNEKIEENPEVIQFLKESISKGHQIGLHGFTHTRIFQQADWKERIKEGKEYLESLFPINIRYFSAPFNYFTPEVKEYVESLGMKMMGPEGDLLEQCVIDNTKLQNTVAWYHTWRFYHNPNLSPVKLSKWFEEGI